MLGNLRGFIVFVIMVTIVLGALRLLSWIPEAVRDGTLQRFATVEEAQAHLKIKRFYLPAFYPESVRWPPVLIGGQTAPYTAVITEFAARDSSSVYLAITQTARPHLPLRESISLTTLREQVRYAFKGRTALLEVGACAAGEKCSRFSWEEGNDHISLTMKSAPMELVRMAESMIPGEPRNGSVHEDGRPGLSPKKLYREN